MITLEFVYVLAGLAFLIFAGLSLGDRANPRRLFNALFYLLVAVSFLAGSRLSDFANGLVALALIIVGGTNLMRAGTLVSTGIEERRARALSHGNWLFAPALLIPASAVLGTLFLKSVLMGGVPLVDPRQVTLISLGFGILLALVVAMLWLRPPPLAPFQEGRRLADTIGWAAILPQMLAALGAVFAAAGVGRAVGEILTHTIPLSVPVIAVAVYCIGMALFTVIMGNAFAAFPVMTAAIGIPLIVQKFGGNPVIMAAIGMLAGFCGTLVTPMAANFNIVPAALLELSDRNGVIRAQFPTAILLLLGNILLMSLLVFSR